MMDHIMVVLHRLLERIAPSCPPELSRLDEWDGLINPDQDVDT